jgi:hypothetical protein
MDIQAKIRMLIGDLMVQNLMLQQQLEDLIKARETQENKSISGEDIE